MSYPRLVLELPPWVSDVVSEAVRKAGGAAGELKIPQHEERMRLAIALSRRSISEGGGPFGAVVFDTQGRVISPGVNLVVPAGASIAHAEIVALSLAQQAIGHFDLSRDEELHLYTSTEPCAQCFGAVPWAGVKKLICAATTDDAEAIGFDEGPKPKRWIQELENRGIAVECELLRDEASAVLRDYATGGGPIYNASGD